MAMLANSKTMRWAALLLCAATALMGITLPAHAAPTCPAGPDADDWVNFRQRFVADVGRVIDTGNHNISHSEGQGYGLLFALAHNARDDFERIWNWTRQTMQQRPDDKLLSWRWVPTEGGHIADINNATDGDILVAWALLRAAAQWRVPAYAAAAQEILADVKRLSIFAGDDAQKWLLPGTQGFVHKGIVTLNPSYFLFPAFQAFAAADNDPTWAELSQSSLGLLARARFGRWQLPPDWLTVAVGTPPQLAKDIPTKGAPPEFGWNALRVPLNLVWGGYSDPWYLEPFDRFWKTARTDGLPAPTVNLSTGAMPEYPGPLGLRVLASYVSDLSANTAGTVWPKVAATENYYSAALLLLTKIACWDTHP
jgi:endoglucanase